MYKIRRALYFFIRTKKKALCISVITIVITSLVVRIAVPTISDAISWYQHNRPTQTDDYECMIEALEYWENRLTREDFLDLRRIGVNSTAKYGC